MPDDRNEIVRIPTTVEATNPNPNLSDRPRVLMFSGGRDSTLASVRMDNGHSPLTLVTVCSSHLLGLRRVKARLTELAKRMRPDTQWLLVRQPTDLLTSTAFYEQTCLPCHHAYVVASGVIARSLDANRLAFGYASYQAHWPEQTPYAVARLTAVLARHGITLELPVRDLQTKEAAITELSALGLSSKSLEQKCLRQVTNVSLPEHELRIQIDLWYDAIDKSLDRLSQLKLEIVERSNIRSIE